MSNYRRKIPVLKDGMAKMIMQQLFRQLRRQKGLTTFVENNGINGKWLKIEDPMDIPVSKLSKIMELKALYQSDDEFISDWNNAGEKFLERVREENKRL